MVRSHDIFPDILHAHTAEMRPAVLQYAENIHTQCVQLIADLGFTSQEELEAAIEADPRHYTESPLREQITRLLELLEVMHAIFENPKEYKLPAAVEFPQKETELRRILGEQYVISFDAIEKAFTLKDNTKALIISPEEREAAMQSLVDKLAEPDIVQFMKHLESDPTEASKWMLVYRTSAHLTDTEGHAHPVSILGLRDVIDTDSRKGHNPTKLVYDFNGNPSYLNDKVESEPDAWASRPVQSGWMFVTRTVVDGTTEKKYPDQTPVLIKKAKALGLADGKFRRRTPQEVLYDTLVVYRRTDGRIRLLEDRYDWTEQETSSGDVVGVGGFGAGGVYVYGDHPDDVYDWNGACLSR